MTKSEEELVQDICVAVSCLARRRSTLPPVDLVVTRHPNLVEYLRLHGFVPPCLTEVVTHATPEQVRGKHVLGVLPHSLSCLCECFTEVPLNLPPELRGKELSVADLEQYAGKPVTYRVSVTQR